MTSEVALFIDLENVLTSMWKAYGQEGEPLKWIEKVRKYGPVGFARGYGDFSQDALRHLEPRLRVAGIEPFACPAKIHGSETQSTVDINVAIDLYEVALDRPSIGTFILMAGDSDYIRIVTRLRNRLGKQVVIAGVPGSVSRDLVLASGNAEDPIEILGSEWGPERERDLIRLIDRFESTRGPSVYPVENNLIMYLGHPSNQELVNPSLIRGKLGEFLRRGILMKEDKITSEGRRLIATRLNRDNPSVQEALT